MNEHYDGFAVDLAEELESIYHWEDAEYLDEYWDDDWSDEDE